MTHTTPETHKLIKESIHLSIHIQETKKGTYSLNECLCPLTILYQVHVIVPPSRPRSLGLDTRVIIRYGWNPRVTIPVSIDLLAEVPVLSLLQT